MKALIDIFSALKETNSVKDKEKLLFENKENNQLKVLLKRNLDPYLLFHIKKIPDFVPHQLGLQGDDNYKAFIGLSNKLYNREITGNEAKEAVRTFFMNSHNMELDLYASILLKGPIGVGASTVNKVWTGLIPEFKLLLAPNKLPNLTQIKYPAIVQPKLDGYRCIYKEGQLWSRSGNLFGNTNLDAYFKDLYSINEYIIDGELYIDGMSFNNLQKILNNHNAPIPAGLRLIGYDCMPLKDWVAQDCKIPYKERLQLLRGILGAIGTYKKVLDIASDEVNDASEVIDLYKMYLKKGYEGVMIKDINGLYRWKRVTLKSGEMVKLKPFKSEDLEIIDVFEGEGQLKGTLGGIIVSNNTIAATNVGTGFSDKLRKEIWENKNNYIGKTAEVQFFEITEEKSLRHPSFKRMRDDK